MQAVRSDERILIVIGAARSGTNMLRDCIAKLDGCDTWPCDEINYIWRYGNREYSSDQFSRGMATTNVREYIRSKVRAFQKKSNCDIVVEKTTANSLRLSFVDEVFPEAKYVLIFRDAIDCVASASLRRKAKLDLRYIYKKAKYIPTFDVPYYAVKYFMNRVTKLLSKENQLATWGPVPLIDLKGNATERSAQQWNECVSATINELSELDKDQYLLVKYENFVENPAKQMSSIAEFLNLTIEEAVINDLVRTVTKTSVGLGHRTLEYSEIEKVILHTDEGAKLLKTLEGRFLV